MGVVLMRFSSSAREGEAAAERLKSRLKTGSAGASPYQIKKPQGQFLGTAAR